MSRVLVIGGGASGMFAAVAAAENGQEVWLLEKNEKLGKKLYLTGKGRCNLTNACDMDVFFSSVVRNRRFLYSSFHYCSNDDVIEIFDSMGLKTKVERGGRVFPVSDHSSDVIRVLKDTLKSLNVHVCLHSEVKEILTENHVFKGVRMANGKKAAADACIIATGGLSYPSTGSTGDGYRFAREMGHHINPCLPSLVPMEVRESWVKQLEGLSLRNVGITIYDEEKKLYQDFGEMLFTSNGISGPMVLSASSFVGDVLSQKKLRLEIDLKPALDKEQLDTRILRDFGKNQNRKFKNALDKLLPAKLIPVVIRLSGIFPEKRVNMITKEERAKLVDTFKHLPMTLTKLRGFDEAVITRGGILTDEINPGTMESKQVKGVYFAGEVMDVDALTGGFNLQIAWSTGYMAGVHAGQES